MNDLEQQLHFAEQLADYRRTFVAIGSAFLQAAASIETGTARPIAIRALERQLVEREAQIDLLGVDLALIAIVGLEAGKAGKAPQEILDWHFKAAPTNAQWRALVDGHRDRREEQHDDEG